MDNVKPPKVSQFDANGNIIAYGAKFYADWGDYDIFPAPGTKPLTLATDLTKAGRNVIGQALALLDQQPRVSEFRIAVPWPVMQRPEIDATRWEYSTLETVPISDLHATQDELSINRVRFYIKNPGAIEENRRAFANVYDADGRLAIVDGHHRLAALWLLGADEALVWMLSDAA